MKILVTRTDRLGDVLLALPTLQYLRSSIPDAEIDFLCKMEIGDVIRPTLDALKIRTIFLPAEGKLKFVKKYDASLFLFWDERLVKAAFWSRIPVRVGSYSKPLSYLLLTKGIRQHRSQARKNEALYNLDLARILLGQMGVTDEASIEESLTLASDDLSTKKIELVLKDLKLERSQFVVVHPGMGGSALNLSASLYVQMIEKLLSEGREVVLSLGPSPLDQAIGTGIRRELPQVTIFEGHPLSLVREFFRSAQWVIAPSTGPLHLAHFAGTSTLGIFSPVLSHSKTRWAPWGGTGESVTLSPDVPCPAKQDCLGSACEYFPCMDKTDWVNLMGKI